jgi:hypothetical protein
MRRGAIPGSHPILRVEYRGRFVAVAPARSTSPSSRTAPSTIRITAPSAVFPCGVWPHSITNPGSRTARRSGSPRGPKSAHVDRTHNVFTHPSRGAGAWLGPVTGGVASLDPRLISGAPLGACSCGRFARCTQAISRSPSPSGRTGWKTRSTDDATQPGVRRHPPFSHAVCSRVQSKGPGSRTALRRRHVRPPRTKRPDNVGPFHGAQPICAGPKHGTPRPPIANVRQRAARDGPSGSTGGFDGPASTMGLTPHARLCEAPPRGWPGQRQPSVRRTASVSWLVETCHARTT